MCVVVSDIVVVLGGLLFVANIVAPVGCPSTVSLFLVLAITAALAATTLVLLMLAIVASSLSQDSSVSHHDMLHHRVLLLELLHGGLLLPYMGHHGCNLIVVLGRALVGLALCCVASGHARPKPTCNFGGPAIDTGLSVPLVECLLRAAPNDHM